MARRVAAAFRVAERDSMFAGVEVAASGKVIALARVGDVDGQLIVLRVSNRTRSARGLVRWLRRAAERQQQQGE